MNFCPKGPELETASHVTEWPSSPGRKPPCNGPSSQSSHRDSGVKSNIAAVLLIGYQTRKTLSAYAS